jgi:putative tricarboxylic transport membrane protein
LAGPGTHIVVTSVAIVIYALSLDTLGFVLCSWVLSSGLAYFYGYRKHLANIVTIGVVVNGLYLLMTRTLDVYLPNAPLPY